MEPITEVQQLLGQGGSVTVGDQTVPVRVLRFGQLDEALQALSAAGPALAALGQASIEEALQRLSGAVAPITVLVRLSTGLTDEQIAELLPDEALRVLTQVVEVNSSFFVQRLAPVLESALSALTGASKEASPPSPPIAPVGPTLSSH